MGLFAKDFVRCTVMLFIVCGVIFAQPKPKAAVYIKGNPQGRDVLMMAVNTFLIKSGRYQMVAVDALDVVAREQNRQMSGTVSDNDIAMLGRDAGAQYVCVIERTELDGISYVTTSMVSVQSKIAELSDMKELPRGERVISVIERQINAMLGITVEEPPPYIPPAAAETGEPPPSYSSAAIPAGYDADPDEEPAAVAAPSYADSRSGGERYDAARRERKPKREKGQSIGLGGFFASDIGGGITWNDDNGEKRELAMPYYGGGFLFFWDWVYLEWFLGCQWGGGEWKYNGGSGDAGMPDMQRAYVNYGALGKYPLIHIGSVVRLFPLYGIDYEKRSTVDTTGTVLRLSNGREVFFDGGKNNDVDNEHLSGKLLDAFWAKFGGGIDIGGGDSKGYFFLRLEALYGIRLTAYDFEKYYAANYIKDVVQNSEAGSPKVKPIPGRGWTVRVSVGFQ
jgi:hypothetical protein